MSVMFAKRMSVVTVVTVVTVDESFEYERFTEVDHPFISSDTHLQHLRG